MKIAFLYAGQGAQYKGMGKDLYDNFQTAKNIFEEASNALGFDIKDICFNDEEKLNITEYTQPAIVTVSKVVEEILKENNVTSDVVAGLSLGEYSAVHAAGAIDFSSLVKLVNIRGRVMQEAVPSGIGKIAVILGLDDDKVAGICKTISTETSIVEPANYNCPGQVVVGGHVEAVDKLIIAAKENGAKRALPLAVSVPSHTSVMKDAARKFKVELDKVEMKATAKQLYANISAKVEEDSSIKHNLEMQMMKATHMGKTILNMIEDGVDTFIEIGPGKALSGFVRNIIKNIDKEIRLFNVENLETLNKVITEIKQC